MLAVIEQTLAITTPVFAMLFLGALLKRIGWIDAAFIETASSLVFRGTMPTLLFLGIANSDLGAAVRPELLLYFIGATVLCFALAWGWAVLRVPFAERGVYTQGAFRGNNGIIGLALATSLYGAEGLALGAVLAGVVILCYNVLSVIVLALYSPQAKPGFKPIVIGIVRNPLIIGVVLAIPFAVWRIPLPAWLQASGQYFAQMTLPLALICIGGTLSIQALRRSSVLALSSSLMKLIWLPLLAVIGACWLGFRGVELGVLYLYFACPTAAASYVMARAVGSNHELAAAIVVITTLLSVLTMNAGLLLMQLGGWI